MTLKEKLVEYSGSAGAITRYVVGFAGGAATVVGFLGLSAISQDQVTQLFEAFKQLGTAISTALTALGTIAGIASAVWGAFKALRSQQTKTVASTPGVQVHVDTSPASPAPVAVQQLALTPAAVDAKAKDVIPMGPGGPVPTGQAAKE